MELLTPPGFQLFLGAVTPLDCYRKVPDFDETRLLLARRRGDRRVIVGESRAKKNPVLSPSYPQNEAPGVSAFSGCRGVRDPGLEQLSPGGLSSAAILFSSSLLGIKASSAGGEETRWVFLAAEPCLRSAQT